MNYFPWEDDEDEDLAHINKIPIEINEDLWKLDEGISCKDWFPDELTFELNPNYGMKLGDSIPNSLSIKVISEKLKMLLEENCNNFEFFPVDIINPKGKKTRKAYYVANLIGTLHCMDLNKSQYRYSNLDKGQMARISELSLDESKIPKGTQIFRLGEMTELLIVADPLAEIISDKNKCTGIFLTYLEDYGLEYRKKH